MFFNLITIKNPARSQNINTFQTSNFFPPCWPWIDSNPGLNSDNDSVAKQGEDSNKSEQGDDGNVKNSNEKGQAKKQQFCAKEQFMRMQHV